MKMFSTIKKFSEIAYNKPMLMQIDTASGKYLEVNGIRFLICLCRYDGIEGYVAFPSIVHMHFDECAGITYLYSHSRSGEYKGIPKTEYFTKEAVYDVVSKEKFIRLFKSQKCVS